MMHFFVDLPVESVGYTLSLLEYSLVSSGTLLLEGKAPDCSLMLPGANGILPD